MQVQVSDAGIPTLHFTKEEANRIFTSRREIVHPFPRTQVTVSLRDSVGFRAVDPPYADIPTRYVF